MKPIQTIQKLSLILESKHLSFIEEKGIDQSTILAINKNMDPKGEKEAIDLHDEMLAKNSIPVDGGQSILDAQKNRLAIKRSRPGKQGLNPFNVNMADNIYKQLIKWKKAGMLTPDLLKRIGIS